MFNNLKDVFNCNIKLYSKNMIESLTVDLKNINRIVFSNSEIFYISEYDAVPVSNNLFKNIIKDTSIDNKNIKNVFQFLDLEFNLLASIKTPISTTTPTYPESLPFSFGASSVDRGVLETLSLSMPFIV